MFLKIRSQKSQKLRDINKALRARRSAILGMVLPGDRVTGQGMLLPAYTLLGP